jgi:hypothetical protein
MTSNYKKRIERLEKAFGLQTQSDWRGITWTDFCYYYFFPKKFPNPEDAPPMALASFRMLDKDYKRAAAECARKEQANSEAAE